MLTRLRIEGFKSWKDTGPMRLAPITALFGTNSSGKTSILQLLLMLKQTAESSDRNQVLDLGDDRALVELGTFDDVQHGHDPESTPRRQYSWGGSQPSDMGRRGEKVVDALLASRETGEKITYGKGRPSMTLEERVASWLKDLGLIESFAVRPLAKGSKLFQVWVRRQARASEVLLTDVGFGVSQILPVITLCYYVPKGSVILLEQPEIHLHPAVQAGLADVFIDAVKARGVQLVIESHSEHLLRRLQRRIAEEQVSADQAALYFSQIRDGASALVPLKLDAFGSIQNWPAGFFGDEFGEIAATQQAILERRLQGAA